ncbi:MAG: hypothetical protein ACN0LA_07185 [Candidatus Longimicrobiales bacterium M2_2A_002]
MIHPAITIQARALADARRTLLDHVAEAGPLPMAALPARWPMTRFLARKVVLDLSRDGLVAFARSEPGGPPLLEVTDAGRRVIETARDP